MYKEDLALNNLQWLISHKTQPIKLIITKFKRAQIIFDVLVSDKKEIILVTELLSLHVSL